ncbi:MAG: NPCBM/NEW2 domain-containing protein [Sedimentisphaerales bacterium]|nr:NPCBM/NEW2 domain-containing protein [Sedimentisphaerales bacterium]
MDLKLKHEIDELLYLALENEASAAHIERLNALLSSDAEIQQYAGDYYFVTAALRKTNAIPFASFDMINEVDEQYNLLMELAREENTAPVLELPREPRETKPIENVQKIHVNRSARKINHISLTVAISSLAALFILIAYLQTVPPREAVAVLADAIDAQWQNASEEVESGRLFYNTDGPLLLKSGLIEIEFNYGARVVIEGPCEFMCKAANLIYLDYGRLYARVPEKATGFTVDTRNARIVDLGTEFGVKENIDETTELHVVKGRTTLLAGQDKQKTAFDVVQGQARQVSLKGQSVKHISLKENVFVQQINSETGMIRKARKIDLADITGGGNGFGTGCRNIGLDPVVGKLADISDLDTNRKADNAYRRVNTNPFIDGVFVPNGRTDQIISSRGHVFSECPVTCGNFFTEISSAPSIIYDSEIVLGDVNYSRSESGFLFIHANLGITYDLNAIRSQLAGVKLDRFQSTIGISDASPRQCNADFWILVDGQVRYRKVNVQQKGIIETVDIELPEDARFLTLVTTDGGDSDSDMVTSMDSDWCLFAEPVLTLE